ncbi:hypothetical protein DB30_02306 [Enhygromyxa salina]|uniref:OmpA-like domain-containing protein n=1 Tax=Enhygromyxa salina TaxID=215803 RepID=A0A0C2CVH8_9BACT|nr:hypothetical protein DB30_02306 [Enhygromyxa salina]
MLAFMSRHGLALGLSRQPSEQWKQIAAALRSGAMAVFERQRALSKYSHGFPEIDLEDEPAAPEPIADELDVVDRRAVEYLAVGDFNFSTDRAVMLPGPSSEGELAGDDADGVALVAGLLAHLRQLDAARRVLVAGHTDAAGSFAHNLELSKRRAESVQLACDGDASGFADHAVAHGETADGQEVLRWTALRFGWGCDPGTVDNDDGPKTSAARQQFRDRFQAEFEEAAGTGLAFVRADWLAFFRLYEHDLAARLGVTATGLAQLRADLVWAKPPVLGCGEHWPEGAIRRSRVNRYDRRVELLCFEPDDLPSGAGDPPGGSVYGDPTYTWTPIRPGPGPHPLGGPCFELALMAEDLEGFGEDASLRLRGGPYDLRHAFADASRRGPHRVFHFHGIAKGGKYTATVESAPDDPVVLFEHASLDSYIAGIDAPDQQPQAIAIHIARPPEQRESVGPYEYSAPIGYDDPEDFEAETP